MLEELRRYNTIGDLTGISYFSHIVLKGDKIHRSSVQKLCALQNSMRLNVGAAIAYFKYLGLITESSTYLLSTEVGKELGHSKSFEFDFNKLCFEKIIDDGLLDLDAVHYSIIEDKYYIEKFGFSITASLFRNILIQYKAIKESVDVLDISMQYEPIFAFFQKKNKIKKSLEKLKAQMEQQEVQGEKAELYVIEYEKRRIMHTDKKEKIKRISVIDVMAGYDIISFDNEKSTEYDRFIEVKSFLGTPHFYWSKNEIDMAKLYGEKYFIYLVDMVKLNDDKYEPEIICNPVISVIESEKWLMSPTSFLVMPIE